MAAGPMPLSAAAGPAMPRAARSMRARSGRRRPMVMRADKAVTLAAPSSAAATAAPGIPGVAGVPRVPAVPGPGGASRLALARRQMAEEAAALRAEQGAPDTERTRMLADLATRIEALLSWLAGDPAATGQPAGSAGLIELARQLRTCDGPGSPGGAQLDALWQEAIRVLTGFAADAGPAASRAFWKRSR
jgi:Ca-activated chloride channel homolog